MPQGIHIQNEASEFRSKLGPNAKQAFRGKKPGQMRHDHQPKLMATLIAYGVLEVAWLN